MNQMIRQLYSIITKSSDREMQNRIEQIKNNLCEEIARIHKDISIILEYFTYTVSLNNTQNFTNEDLKLHIHLPISVKDYSSYMFVEMCYNEKTKEVLTNLFKELSDKKSELQMME